MSQPLTKSPDELIAQLAELDEQQESGTKFVPTGSTIENLKAELETLLSDIRQPLPRDEYADESACEQVIQSVQTIGREPSDPGDKTVATPTEQPASSTASAPTLASLGHYELLSKIGEGGMGAVYKARNKKLDKIVALKVLPKDKMQDKSSVARFEREMRAVGKLDHPHIVRAMDAGEENGTHFLVMEYVQGIDLSQLVKQLGPLPVAEACELIRQAAVGLDEAHDHGMVHRDIKPSNLMLCVPGKRQPPVVKILDMGLALLSDAHASDVHGLTSTGQMMGTVDYMAPEQGDDSKGVDIRADLYSLGASLYKLLTGETVYHGGQYQTLMQKMMGLASKPAPPIRECRADIPLELAAVVHRLLEKDLSQRFATPDEVAQALAPFAAGANLASLLTKVGYEGLETTVADEAKSHTTPSASAPDVDTGTMPRHSLPSTVDHLTPADAALPSRPASRAASAPGRVSGTALAAGLSLGAGFAHGKSTPRDTTTPVASAIPLPAPVASAIPLTTTAVLPVRRRAIPKQRVALALGGVLLMLLAAVVYRIQTDQGTLVVTIDDPAVQAILEQDGLVIRDKHSDRTWTIKATESQPLPSGKYQVEGKPNLQLLVTDDSGAEVTTNEFTLKRKREVRVRVTLEPGALIAGNESPKSAASEPDRRAAEWVLSVGGIISIKENGQEREIKAVGDLPLGAFELTAVSSTFNPQVTDAGLAHFKGCKNLKILYLASPHVSDAGLAHFKECKNLTFLRLNGTQVSDAGLAHFKECKNFTFLEVDSAQVSDAGMAHFKDCKNIETLYLRGTKVSDVGLGHFRDFKSLLALDLRDTDVSDEGLVRFKDCKNLKTLDLNTIRVSDAGLAHLKDCKNVIRLALNNTRVSDAGLAHFKDCKNLAELVLDKTQVSDVGLAHFKDCKNLTYLNLSFTQVSDAGLECFADCPKLSGLDIRKTKVTEAGVKKLSGTLPGCKIEWDGGVIEPRPTDPDRHAAEYVLSIGGNIKIKDNGQERAVTAVTDLPRGMFELTGVVLDNNRKVSDAGLAVFKDCKNLTMLSLDCNNNKVTDAGLAYFKDCKNLTALNLGNIHFSDVGLAHFKECKNLTNLNLNYVHVGNAGLAHFEDCENLTGLSLIGSTVSDAGLAHLEKCKNLRFIYLGYTQVSDAGLAHFKDCKNITVLNLSYTQVADARLADLASRPSLTELHLANTRVSLHGHEQLKAALPKCQITWSEPNRSVAESVLALGGTVEIGSLDKPESRPVQVAADLPGDYFQVRRVSLAGVTKPLDPLRPLLAWLTFPQFDRLESIDLSGSTGLDYSFLVPIHGLRELTLANAGLNDAALANLPKLPTLQRLVLDGNDIRGSGLTHLSHQPELIDLSLSHPNLTNLSAENLAELKPLKRLSLAGSGLTNAGIKHLANLTNLESLDLRRTKVTAVGIDELQKTLPNCQIEWDGKKAE